MISLTRRIAHTNLAVALGGEQHALHLLRKHKPAGEKAAAVTPHLNEIRRRVKGAHMDLCAVELGERTRVAGEG